MPETAPAVPVQTPAVAAATPAVPAPASTATAPAPAVSATAQPVAARLLGDEKPATPAAEPAKVEAPKAEAPKAAEWTLTAPKDTPITAERAKAIETFAKAEGMNQAQAEKIMAREAGEVSAIGKTWHEQCLSHPEIGGANYDGAIDNANRALAQFATPEERATIMASEFRKNPLFIAILNRAGKTLTREDTVITSTPAPAAKMSAAQRIYGKP